MSVNFNAALNAYNNAAKINSDKSAGNSASVGGVSNAGFSEIMDSGIDKTIGSLRTAESTIAKSLVKQADITDVVTAVTNAEMTLRTVMEIRNKMVAAYQEIIKMPI